MEDKQTYRLISLARIFQKPILATPLGQGIAMAVAIAAKISAESQLGVGSRFHIYLPLIA